MKFIVYWKLPVREQTVKLQTGISWALSTTGVFLFCFDKQALSYCIIIIGIIPSISLLLTVLCRLSFL